MFWQATKNDAVNRAVRKEIKQQVKKVVNKVVKTLKVVKTHRAVRMLKVLEKEQRLKMQLVEIQKKENSYFQLKDVLAVINQKQTL